jgi:branched-chain amino acid transport system ATP-binding protein
LLQVNQIDVYRGKVHILREVSFLVEKGEIVAIVGSNGVGKTTLLKTISGILRPVRGTIETMGTRLDGLLPHKIVDLGVIHVPEGRKLFSPLSVLENLEMGSYLLKKGTPKSWTLNRTFNLFPILQERKNQLAGSLSGGEQQMLAIARGLMSGPKLMMLDEPSLGLAPLMVKELFRIVKEINEEGVTVLLVEQNVKQSLSIADRGYVLEDGRIVLSGTGDELLEDEGVRKAYLGI